MKWFKRIVLAVVAIVVIVAGVAFWLVWSSLPDYDGTLVATGLGHEVRIVRDANAIPHIEADTLDDAVFGLGYVHAQDRLWQMEMNRRTAQGRLAEALGAGAIKADRFLRTMSFERRAKSAYEGLNDRTKALLKAYSAGVNAYLATREFPMHPLPPEFLLTMVTPEPWQPHHSVGWLKMMAYDLGGNFKKELERMAAAKHLDARQMAQYFAPYPDDGPIALNEKLSFYRSMAKKLDVARLLKDLPPSGGDGVGSNNWVVAGHRTVTGKPLLANDPHLGLKVPAVWYFAHLKTPEGEVIGATLPGVPGVILGTNGKMAWGFTNTGPDVQDLYIEEIDPDDPKKYRTPEGSEAFIAREEIIKVKGGDDVTLEVRETRHGPVITGAYGPANQLTDATHVLAMRWTALDADDTSTDLLSSLLSVDRPTSFINAMRSYVVPQQNMVFADVVGNIGYIAPGRVPIRAPENETGGKMPVKGWVAANDWIGSIPYDKLPRVINPITGYVMTANNKVVPKDYPYFITDDWAEPYRAMRAETLLKQTPKHSIDSFKAMQLDVTSRAAQDLMPLMLKSATGDDDRQKAILAAMAEWKGTMEADRPEPLIYSVWYRELTRLIEKDELKDAFQPTWKQRAVFVTGVLKDTDGAGAWCKVDGDNTTCAKLIDDAFTLAVQQLTTKYGEDWKAWKWSAAHAWASEHNPFHGVAALAWFLDIVHPTGGGTYTLNVARTHVDDDKDPFRSTHGPSLRAIYDLSNLSNSVFIYSTGQSGHFLSPHYSDLGELWAKGEYIPVRIDPAVYKDGAVGILTLKPE